MSNTDLIRPADIPDQLRLRASRMCADGYFHWDASLDRAAADALEAAEARIAECDPYLKDGETPRQRMDRDVRENQALLKLLAEARARSEAAEAERDAAVRLAEENWQKLTAFDQARAAAVARAERAEAALREIAEQDDVELVLDPEWAKRIARAALKEAKP